MKKYIFILIFGNIIFSIYGFSPIEEYFVIENNLEYNIIVELELNAELILDNEGVPISTGRTYFMELNGIPLTIRNDLYRNFIRPNERYSCIMFRPSGGAFYIILQGYYEMLENISGIDKIKSIIKTLVIKNDSGDTILLLNNLVEENIIKQDSIYLLKVTYDLIN